MFLLTICLSLQYIAYVWTINTQVAKCVEIGLPELILLVIFAMVPLNFYAYSCCHALLPSISVCSNCPFPFYCFVFAVPATCYTHAEVYLRPICCSIHYSHSVALCISAHGWRSIQECATKDPISLPHWPLWTNWWCSLVLLCIFEDMTVPSVPTLAVKVTWMIPIFYTTVMTG